MALLLLTALLVLSGLAQGWDGGILMPTEKESKLSGKEEGVRWAILVAGSYGYGNYRHQADVCHAYQVLKKGGMKEENIITFLYDDIAHHPDNPYPGTIINHPHGPNVYHGVPKDYTGRNVTMSNFIAALLGEKEAIKGGSGKVVNSGPEDHIFIYYSDHGGVGVLGMPTTPHLYAGDFLEALKKKHAAGTFKEMVIYLEACESGSMFEGLSLEDMNIYVTTASNAEESSWATYCPGMVPSAPFEYDTCLGDLYSVAWMEDAVWTKHAKMVSVGITDKYLTHVLGGSEIQNLKKETLSDQYLIVKSRTSNHNTYKAGSHVMQYGDVHMTAEPLELYLGFDPATEDATDPMIPESGRTNTLETRAPEVVVNQRDGDLHYLWHKYWKAREGSTRKAEAGMDLVRTINHHMHLDTSMDLIGKLLFGSENGPSRLSAVRPPGQVSVDDWDCLKNMVRAFESSCGELTQYGMKHMRAFANICNAGIDATKMATTSAEACALSAFGSEVWHPVKTGFSA